MKKSILLLAMGGLAGLVLWWKRHSIFPAPQVDTGPAPAFRRSPAPRPAPVATEAEPPAAAAAAAQPEDDLRRIKGIGPVYDGRLHDAGIRSFSALIAADSQHIAAALDVAPEAVEDWKRQAAELS